MTTINLSNMSLADKMTVYAELLERKSELRVMGQSAMDNNDHKLVMYITGKMEEIAQLMHELL